MVIVDGLVPIWYQDICNPHDDICGSLLFYVEHNILILYEFPKKPPYLICKINTLRPRQDGRHFPDDIFKEIFLNENVWISIKNLLKFVPKGPMNSISSLVQTRRQAIVWTNDGQFIRFIYASPGFIELRHAGLYIYYCLTAQGKYNSQLDKGIVAKPSNFV